MIEEVPTKERDRKPEVVNFHADRNILSVTGSLYIGRPKKGDPNKHFGNPFSHIPGAMAIHVPTREDSVKCCKDWLEGTAHQEVEPERRKWILENLHRIREAERVVCWCAPKSCHGHTLVDLAFKK